MTPRSLVGMTMGARKRLCREDQRLEVAGEDLSAAAIELLHKIRSLYRIGQRLQPCPGCAKCSSVTRRFMPRDGYKGKAKWVLWDGVKLWSVSRSYKRALSVTASGYPGLPDFLNAVADGAWKELFCDGSGVLPARAKKVMR